MKRNTRESLEHFAWRLIAKTFTRSIVHAPDHVVHLTLRDLPEVSSFGKILSDQAISIFIRPTLPGRVRVRKVDLQAKPLFELHELRELLPVVQRLGMRGITVQTFIDSYNNPECYPH